MLYFKKLFYKRLGCKPSKAGLETSRLFFKLFWYIPPIKLITFYSKWNFFQCYQSSQNKKYPQFLRIKRGRFLGNVVRICLRQFRPFAAMRNTGIFLWLSYIGTGCSGTKNNNNKFKHQERTAATTCLLYTSPSPRD